MLITVSAADVTEYRGSRTPSYAMAFANKKFTTSEGIVVAAGSERKPEFGQRFEASLVGQNIRLASGDLYSTVDSSDPTATYTIVVYDTRGKKICTVFDRLRVPANLSPLTWDYLRVYSAARTLRDKPTYLNSTEILALLADMQLAPTASDVLLGRTRLRIPADTLSDPVVLGANDTTGVTNAVLDATELIKGKSKLTHAPASVGTPIAVGANDPKWRAISETYYLEADGHSQAGVNAAIAAIGATVTKLRITEAVNITTDTEFPANILVELEGNARFNVANATRLTINCLAEPPIRETAYFTGDGETIVAGGHAVVDWWTGTEHGGTEDLTQAVAQAVESIRDANKGGLIEFARTGVYAFDGFGSLPSGTRIKGRGGVLNADRGTIFKPFTTDAEEDPVYMVLAENGFYNIAVEDVAISTDGNENPASRPVLLQGVSPNSAFGFLLRNVTLHSTAAESWLHEVKDTAAAGAWECVGIIHDNVKYQAAKGGGCLKGGSINTLYQLNNPSAFLEGGDVGAGVLEGALEGADFMQGTFGWVTAIERDIRGPGSPAATATVNRNINVTIANGGTAVTVTSGALSMNDMGQRLYKSGKVDAYITDIGADGTTATISSPTTGAMTNEQASVQWLSPTLAGRGGCLYRVTGDHNSIQFIGGADEGIAWLVKNEVPTNEHPIVFRGGTVQTQCQLDDPCVLIFDGTRVDSNLINDAALVTANVSFINCTLNRRTANQQLSGPVIELAEFFPFNTHLGATIIPIMIGGIDEGFQRNTFGVQTRFFDVRTGTSVEPTAIFANAGITPGGPHRPVQVIGRLNAVTGKFDHGYGVYRNYGEDSGTSLVAAVDGIDSDYNLYGGMGETRSMSQATPWIGWRFKDMPVLAETFIGNVKPVASLIASNQNNYSLGDDHSRIIELDTDGNERTITGLMFDTQGAGFPFPGQEHIIRHVGNDGPIVFAHESSSSDDANRIVCDGGGDLRLLPGEYALLTRSHISYGDTGNRWHLRLLGQRLRSRSAANVTYNANATLANITGLSFNVLAGATYRVKAVVFTSSAAKALAVDFGGTSTDTSFKGDWKSYLMNAGPVVLSNGARVTARGTDFTDAAADGDGYARYEFDGIMVVNAAGTITMRGAQNTSNASNTVIEAAVFSVERM